MTDDLFETILKVMFLLVILMLLVFVGSLTAMLLLDLVNPS